VQDPHAARAMNSRLASILRYAIDGSEKEFVTLQQELDFVRDYLEIEKIRLEDNLKVELNIDEKLMDILVPPMTLEPLVENAIKHGIAERSEGGILTIAVEKADGKLRCQVSDTGRGISSKNEEGMLKRGMGLQNTLERLKRLYQNEFTFSIENNTPSGCTVTLSLPIKER
jgi:LytS/YehU family sensor histidine kinase